MPAGEQVKQEAGTDNVNFYGATYGRFTDVIYGEIRRETWDEDFGQNGWITAQEQDRFIARLALGRGKRLLDIACGSGGPSLRIAERTGATVVGVDIHADGIKVGQLQAAARGLEDVASFQVVDAQELLPFANSSFDAITCIDAINHLADRPRVLAEWSRVLKPNGHLLFTDPAVVTGPLTNEEIAARCSIGFFLLVAPTTDDRMLKDAGFEQVAREDLTDAVARTAGRWHVARQKRAADLKSIEGVATFDGQQRFLAVAARIAQESCLSRFAYTARKPI